VRRTGHATAALSRPALLLVAAAFGWAALTTPAGAATSAAPTALPGLERLPLAAQGPVSAAIAREDPDLPARVDDRGAAYQLRIDPFAQLGELTASHGLRGEELGESVAVSGNTIVVGTPNYVLAATNTEQGAAYVFTRSASGWAHARVARLTAARGQSEELFGACVSVSGDTIVVGAPFREVGGHAGQGAAYVFVKPASGWKDATPTAKLTAARGAAKDFFGESVAISARTIVVGVPGRKVGRNARQGAVDVFTRPAAGWAGSLTQKAELTASNGQLDDGLGGSVAVSGNAIAAGADRHTVGSNVDQGAAYVFVKPRSGWARSLTQSAELTAETGSARESFGEAVGMSGNTIVAGAPEREVGEEVGQGALYVFVRPVAGWAGSLHPTAQLTASDAAKNEAFGRSLSVAGDVVAAGARYKEVAENTDQGAVYVFVGGASGWATATQTAELTASNGTTGDSLGRSVAVAGDTIVAGAPDHAVGRNLAQGAVYVFGDPSLRR
jgi:FG-GAP repeat